MTTRGATAEPAISDSTKLGVDRTRLAYERTLMSWIRTAISLISFGFTIYKFFEYLREQGASMPVEHRFGARQFAGVMICVGLVSLLFATLQHWRSLKALRETYDDIPYSEAMLLAVLISAMGILAFLAVIFRE
jgi:putative membrane protein